MCFLLQNKDDTLDKFNKFSKNIYEWKIIDDLDN